MLPSAELRAPLFAGRSGVSILDKNEYQKQESMPVIQQVSTQEASIERDRRDTRQEQAAPKLQRSGVKLLDHRGKM